MRAGHGQPATLLLALCVALAAAAPADDVAAIVASWADGESSVTAPESPQQLQVLAAQAAKEANTGLLGELKVQASSRLADARRVESAAVRTRSLMRRLMTRRLAAAKTRAMRQAQLSASESASATPSDDAGLLKPTSLSALESTCEACKTAGDALVKKLGDIVEKQEAAESLIVVAGGEKDGVSGHDATMDKYKELQDEIDALQAEADSLEKARDEACEEALQEDAKPPDNDAQCTADTEAAMDARAEASTKRAEATAAEKAAKAAEAAADEADKAKEDSCGETSAKARDE